MEKGDITFAQLDKLICVGMDRVAWTYVDAVIDKLRTKYHIMIYNTAEPFVNAQNKVEYGFSVKVCSSKWGWNARKYLGKTKWRTNIYQAKREAINIALRWILSHKSQKSKKSKRK